MGVASLVLGIIGLLFSCVPCFSQLLALLGFIFGIVGAAKKSKEGESKGCAIAGIVLSSITLVFSIIIALCFVLPAIAAGTLDSILYYY